MVRIRAFAALRPQPNRAPQIASVPYDVINTDEARELAKGNPLSFLHVVRSEIDLPPATNPYDDAVYAKARENLDHMVNTGTLVRESAPVMYLYRQVMNHRAQIGLVACVHVDDYLNDVIRKHEKTRKDKEDDRTKHVLTMNANAEPVFLAYRDQEAISDLMDRAANERPLFHFITADHVTHTVWAVPQTEPFVRAFARLDLAYIADGHHRSASAARAGAQRREEAQKAGRRVTGDEEFNWFLAVLFPASQLTIMPYNRVVKDLHGQSPEQVRAKLATVGTLIEARNPSPAKPGTVCVYLEKRWWQLEFEPKRIPAGDPIRSLDVSLLQELVLTPMLGVGDPRTDKRIDFVGGIRGTRELEERVNRGEAAIAFSMFPTTIHQVFAVSDAGQIMPPKSTWFEPKLRSGLFVHTLQ